MEIGLINNFIVHLEQIKKNIMESKILDDNVTTIIDFINNYNDMNKTKEKKQFDPQIISFINEKLEKLDNLCNRKNIICKK